MKIILNTAVMLSVAMSAQAAEIELRDISRPVGSIVRLRDVASISEASEAELARLADRPLMTAPAPGTQQYVRAQAIRELLQAMGERLSDHKFSGAATVEVRGSEAPNQPYAVERTEDIIPEWRPKPKQTSIKAAPAASVGFRGTAVPVRRVSRLSGRELLAIIEGLKDAANLAAEEAGFPDTLRAADVRIEGLSDERLRDLTGAEATLVENAPILGGRETAIRFRTPAGGELLSVRFEEVAYVVVASRPLRRGELITSANTEIKRSDEIEGVPVPADAFGTLDQAAGLEAKRSIRVGEPLSPAICVGPLLVRRGDPVVVASGVGYVTARLRGKARDDGRLGDIVSVEVHDRDRLEARVTGPGELAILSGRPTPNSVAANPAGGLR